MKTKLKTLLGLVALFLFIDNRIAAQTCSYVVNNNLDCDIDVVVDYINVGNNTCASIPANIPPNSPQNFNCGGCGQLIDVKVTLLAIGGGTIAPMTVQSSPSTAGPNTLAVPACSNSGVVQMSWATGGTAVIP